MPTPKLKIEVAQQAVDALDTALRSGYRLSGEPSAFEAAAQALGIPHNTLRGRVRRAKIMFGIEHIDDQTKPVVIDIPPISKPRVIVRAVSTAKPDKAQRIVVIGDAHVGPGQDLSRFKWFARYVGEVQPNRVVQIGDLSEFASVSGHERPGSLQQKIKPAFQQDLEATEEALAIYRKTLGDTSIPHHITEGNHEDRLDRWDSLVAETSGVLRDQYNDLMARYNWRQTPYRGFLFIEGVGFTHVPQTLREQPYNGKTANPVVNELVFSLVWGHSHRFAYITAPKIGPSQSVEALNVGTAAPVGWYPSYNVSEQGGYTYGIVECLVACGHIVGHKFVTLHELEERYGD